MIPISATATESGSVFSPIIYCGDLVESVRRAAACGFDGIELHIRNPLECDPERLKNAVDSHNLTLTTIGMGRAYLEEGLCFCDPDPDIRMRAVARVHSVMDVFSDYRPRTIIGLMRGALANAPDRETGIRWIEECLIASAEYAAKHEMTILIEAANRYELDYLHTAEECFALINRVQIPNLKILLDTFHMNIEETSFAETLKAYAPYIGHLHFSDNNRRYPGAGMINFDAIFRVLREIAYAGTTAVECLPWPDSDTAARCAFDTLDRARRGNE